MRKKRILQAVGAVAIVIGLLSTAYDAYGLYLHFAFTEMLSSLGIANQASTTPLAVSLAASMLLAGLGIWLFRKAGRQS